MAQQATIVSERPSFSATPFVVGPGIWQIESGYDYARDGGSFKGHVLPNLLLRYGLSDEFELQFAWAGFSRVETGAGSTTGVTDSELGLKIAVTDATATVPVAFFAGLSLPTGESGFTSDSFDPRIGAFWAHRGSLDWFGGVTLTKSGSDYSLDNGVGLSFSFAEDVSGYAEWEVNLPDGGDSTHSLNLGVTWLQNSDLQFDVNGNVGLNSRAIDYGLGVGLAYRF